MLKFIKLPLNGAHLVELESFEDNRGIFARLFCQREFSVIDHQFEIVQINHSINFSAGALRGMHFQHRPMAEIKIVKCIKGAVFDVIVDLRKGSPTLLQYHAEQLTAANNRMIFIPEGFAHGFQTLEPNSELLYFHSQFYDKASEGAIRYNDPLVKIQWPMPVSEISDRDSNHAQLPTNFKGFTF